MSLKTFLSVTAIAAVTIFSSCKKNDTENTTTDEFETTFEISGDEAVTDNLTQDDNDVLNEAAIDKNFMGNNFTGGTGTQSGTAGTLSCATVTITPLIGWPKNIVIDFGTGCLSNGVFRKGKINVK